LPLLQHKLIFHLFFWSYASYNPALLFRNLHNILPDLIFVIVRKKAKVLNISQICEQKIIKFLKLWYINSGNSDCCQQKSKQQQTGSETEKIKF